MKIRRVLHNKEDYLPLLLLADPEEHMIRRYLERGDLFVLPDQDGRAACVAVVALSGGSCELKNLATREDMQRQGCATQLLDYLFSHYAPRCSEMFVGTGDSPLTLPFYQHRGFVLDHRVKNFFTDNYEQPIYEAGELLRDMVYLKKSLAPYRLSST